MTDGEWSIIVVGTLLIIVLPLGIIPLAKLITNWIVDNF